MRCVYSGLREPLHESRRLTTVTQLVLGGLTSGVHVRMLAQTGSVVPRLFRVTCCNGALIQDRPGAAVANHVEYIDQDVVLT